MAAAPTLVTMRLGGFARARKLHCLLWTGLLEDDIVLPLPIRSEPASPPPPHASQLLLPALAFPHTVELLAMFPHKNKLILVFEFMQSDLCRLVGEGWGDAASHASGSFPKRCG